MKFRERGRRTKHREASFREPADEVGSQSRQITRTGRLGILLFGILAVSLILSLFFKARWLWMDEVLSMTMITDPSLAHLNQAMVSGIDSNPPLFPNLYWLLGHAISFNPFFLRSVSAVFFAATIAWFYRFVTGLIGSARLNWVLFVLIISFTFLDVTLATQVRGYGLYLLVGGLYFFAALRLALNPERYSLWFLHFGAAVAILFTHDFGLFYLAASGAWFVLLAIGTRHRAYLIASASHVAALGVWFLTWYSRFAIQAQTGNPHSWIPLPTIRSFFFTVGELAPAISAHLERMPAFAFLAPLRFFAIVGLFVVIATARWKRWGRAALADPAYLFYLLSGFIYLGVIVLATAVSFLHTSILLSRYLWPSHLLVIYQIIYAFYFGLERFGWSWNPIRRVRRGWLLAVCAAAVTGFLFYQSRKLWVFSSNLVPYLTNLFPRLPIFVSTSDYFLPLWYQRSDLPVRYLLDWPDVSRENNQLGATVEYKIMESMRKFYDVKGVVRETEFSAATYPHFYFVEEDGIYLMQRFIDNGTVRVVREVPVPFVGEHVLECTFR